MRIFPIITATLVCVALYFLILDRETLMSFAGRFGGDAVETAAGPDDAAPVEAQGAGTETDERVHVVVRRSLAQVTENAVVLRGRTEALRQVVVSAETSGRIVSDPLRAGARGGRGAAFVRDRRGHPAVGAGRGGGPSARGRGPPARGARAIAAGPRASG
jgi:hypothetical protein